MTLLVVYGYRITCHEGTKCLVRKMALLEISRRVLWSCNESFSASVSQLNWPWVDSQAGGSCVPGCVGVRVSG